MTKHSAKRVNNFLIVFLFLAAPLGIKLRGHSDLQGLMQRLVSVHATNIQSIARR
jgi:hypothetical protein